MLIMTDEFKKKCRAAKSADELVELAKGQGETISKAQAEQYFSAISGNGEVSDEELGAVAGGGCGGQTDGPTVPHAAKFKNGDYVCYPSGSCPKCAGNAGGWNIGSYFVVIRISQYGSTPDEDMVFVRCPFCHAEIADSVCNFMPYTGKTKENC